MDIKKKIRKLLFACDYSGKYSAKDISQYLLWRCTEEELSINNLQLQKILYFLQIAFLKDENYALFSDEIEAWVTGPVVKSVYSVYCGYGAVEIYEFEKPLIQLSTNEERLINEILHDKLKYKIWDLAREVCEEGKPWDLTYSGGAGEKKVISKFVLQYYS